MVSVAGLLDRAHADAAIAWVVTAVLTGAVGQFLRLGEPDWAALTALLVATALVVPVATRDPLTTMPGELFALVAVPVLVRAASVGPTTTPFFAVAGLALLVAVVLDAFTSLAMTPRFAVVFVVVTTLAFAGAWTVGSYAADVLVGTALIDGQAELMWDLVAAAGTGLLAGVVFEAYFEFSGRIARLGGGTGRVGAESDPDADLPGEAHHHSRAVVGMQVVLAGIAGLAVLRGEPTLLVNSLGPLAITFLPAVFERRSDYTMDTGLVLWITLAATLHAVGAAGLYQSFGWFDSLTHALSASLVAGMGYAVARAVETHTHAVTFNRPFRATFTVLFVLAIGVVWEILEFATGGLSTIVGGEAILAQYGTGDIVNDLVFNTLGAILVAGWSSAHFEGIARRLADRVGVAVRGGE
jgi:hypothetical protein